MPTKLVWWPSRTKALAIAGAVISSFAFQTLTTAQAAALWTQSAHSASSRTIQAASRAGNDPAYQPPAKHGTSYVAPTPAAKPGSSKNSSGTEKPNLRTRNSRTFSSGGRQLTTLVYADSVNYRDGSGAWQAIDDSLIKTGLAHYAHQNKANRYTVYLPADIGSAPIRIAFGSSWLTFSLQGAKGTGSMAGSVASYRNALPGVTVVVDAQADTLEESLVLQGPASPSQFTYELQMSPGLKLNPAGAGFSIVDASGRTVFGVAAPAMYDSAKNGGARSSGISMSATKDSQGTAVTLKADPAWLASAARKWPVTIDPTFLVGDVQDCYINAGSPTTSFCGGAALNAGYDGTNASRALLQFSLAAIPSTDAVLSAKLLLYLGSASTSTATSLGVYQLTRTWTTGATWNSYDGTNSWTAPGGDFSGTAAGTTNGIAATGVWYSWSPTTLVQGWVNGTIANDGLLLKEPTENVTNVLAFNSATATNPAYLQVVHQQGGSTPGSYSTTVSADSPSAYWRMDETSGSTMVDAQGADSGTYQGGFTLAQSSLIQPASGTSVSLNGSNGYATAPTLSALQGDNTRGVELWFQTTNNGGEPLFDSGNQGGPNGSMFNLQLTGQGTVANNPPPPNSPGLYLVMWGEDVYIPGLYLADGKRHQVVAELSGSNLWIYVDNATPGGYMNVGGWNTRYLMSQPFSLPTTPNTTGNPVLIGSTRTNEGGSNNFFQGQIDEVAVYATALSATQIQNHWQAGNGLPWSPTSVSATSGQNQVALSWTAPTFNGSGITGYVVTPQVGSNLRTPITFNSSATSQTITNLSGGTGYTFTVTAFNSLGLGVPSSLSSSATPTGAALPLYEDTVLADSPVGFWPLGETSGNVATDLTQTYNGAETGPYTQGDAGPTINVANKATSFAGSNSFVRLNHTTLLEPTSFTVEAWIKPSSVPQNDTVVVISPQPGTSENSTANGYDLMFGGVNGANPGKLTFNAASSLTTAALPINAWTYVVGTSDGTAMRLYVNGKQTAAVTAGGSNYGGAPNFDGFITRFGFPGDISDVAIYSAALTPTQLASHYAAAGYGPGPISNLVATPSTNSASLTWTAPTYVGPSAITSYTVTPIVDATPGTPVTVGGNGNGANIANLAGAASYTFRVQANGASASGVIVNSAAVTVTSPAAGPNTFGSYLSLKGGGPDSSAFAHYGFVSRNNAPALSTWTLEARLWGFQNMSTLGAHAALGYLSGTVDNPTDQNPIAGLYFDLSANHFFFVWPGGSCQIDADNFGIPFAFNSATTSPAHVALTFDGTTVRAFINGAPAVGPGPTFTPCSYAASAALPAAPFGLMDNAGLSTANLDEIRISNNARWTANFSPPGAQYAPPYDGNSVLLWHFNDYQISKLPSTHIIGNLTDGAGFPFTTIPSMYRDSIGSNHANTLSKSDVGAGDDWRRPYSLGQGVTVDELVGGRSEWLCVCTTCSAADPVSDATGEFYHTFADFHIAGRIDLDLTRTYSSFRTTILSPIGYGWTDNYNIYITTDGAGNATVHEANGSSVVFAFDSSHGTYGASPAEHVSLNNSAGIFTLTDVGGNQLIFNALNGNTATLNLMKDRHAYTLTLSYYSPPDNRLHTVTDPGGRTLTFVYGTIPSYNTVTITDSGSPARSVTLQIGNDQANKPLEYNELVQVTDVAGGVAKFTYDSDHYLLTMIDPKNGTTTNHYDTSTPHRITSQDDPMSPARTTTFSYSGGVTTITDPKGNVTQEEYLNGILLSRTLGPVNAPLATWTYAFDPTSLGMTAAVGPNGETVTNVRDANLNVLGETDGLGRTTSYTYNSFGEPLTIQDPSLVTTTNTYNATGDLATTSRPLVGTQQVQTVTYNHADSSHPGDVTSMVDADNFTWTYTYDGNGYRNSVTDPLGNKTTYVFNADGWMTSSTAPNQYLTRLDTFVRTPVSGSWGTATDGNVWTKQAGSATYSTTGTQGKIAKPSSDSWESLGSVVANDGGEIVVRWQVATTSDKAGAVLRLSSGAATFYGVRFDGAGHVELFGKWGGAIHTNIGGVRINYTPGTALQRFRFRVAGNTLYFKVWADGSQEPANWSGQTTDTNVTGAGFAGLYGNATNTTGVKFDQFTANPYATTTYTYNNFGKRTGLTDPENHTTSWHYDPNQNLDQITDANNNLTTNVYDADNELTQVKRADSPQTTLTTDYNPDGTVLDQKDGKGNAIQTYAYDSLAHLTTVTDAVNNVTTYVYDAHGNMLSKQDPGGNCSATPPTSCTTYTYDAANQLTGISYSDGVTPNVSAIAYDADGQRLSMTDGTGSSSWGWDSLHRIVSYRNGHGDQVAWIYNLRSLPTTITYPGTLNVTRGYDNAGRWTSVRDWNSNTTTFGYDAESNLTKETFPAASGVVDTFTFNAADQVTNVASVKGGSTTLLSAVYSRDSANQLSTDSSAASGTSSYKYTSLNQLCYAGSANSTACTAPPTGSIIYKYDAADNLTQKGTSFQAFNNADEVCYSGSGNTNPCSAPPSGATTYQYDTRGNRTNVNPSGGQAQTLTYDQANRLTKFSASSTTSYGYNGDGLRMCKFAGSSSQPCQAMGSIQFLWDVADTLALLLKDGATSYVYGPGGLPLEQVSGGTTYWYHHDQIGSTRLITNSTATTPHPASYTYDPYGGIASISESITNPFRFDGQYQEAESGLYYLRARYYDLVTAQFLTRDPISRTTHQPYAYASSNPLNSTDPSGQGSYFERDTCGCIYLSVDSNGNYYLQLTGVGPIAWAAVDFAAFGGSWGPFPVPFEQWPGFGVPTGAPDVVSIKGKIPFQSEFHFKSMLVVGMAYVGGVGLCEVLAETTVG